MKLLSSVIEGIGFAVVASAFALGACGGDKSTVGGGTGGGASDVGGSSSVGGGSNGGAATGGSTGTSSGPVKVPSALMTDFSEITEGTTMASSIAWGSKGLTGGTFTYQQDTGDTPVGTVTGGALNIAATVAAGHYAGVGLYFGPNGGSDASAFSGFAFDISGSLGGATVDVQMQMTPDYPLKESNKGTCDYVTAGYDSTSMWNYCTNPHVELSSILAELTTTPATVKVPWSLLIGGNPVPEIDPTQLLGIQFQFNCGSPDCVVNINLDNITFYN
jgi:hypothetical protein